MVLEHLAAILLFSGPLLYIGLWMAIDPAGIAMIPAWFVRVFQNVVGKFGGLTSGEIIALEHVAICRRTKTALRLAGVVLVLFAIVA
jgi:hypothetical protein